MATPPPRVESGHRWVRRRTTTHISLKVLAVQALGATRAVVTTKSFERSALMVEAVPASAYSGLNKRDRRRPVNVAVFLRCGPAGASDGPAFAPSRQRHFRHVLEGGRSN